MLMIDTETFLLLLAIFVGVGTHWLVRFRAVSSAGEEVGCGPG